ncbi:MAG: 16S rRNA (uracil(1498)-N(3))-methyltransferase [Flaviflexus sp.]|nr:16S rRNA (uracil(1498)-N(3))-methyltransferase [Flaviflexus sp.]
MTRPVFYAPHLAERVELDAAEAKHLKVMRLRDGEEFDVVDGRGTRMRCTLEGGELRSITTEHDQGPRHPITLVQALAKGGRDERAIEAAIAVGATRIIPWSADRSIVKWSGKEKKAHASWEALALAAMKQSRQSWRAEISQRVTSAELARSIETTPERVIILEAGSRLGLREALGELPDNLGLWLIVGPEGGISPSELADFEGAGAIPARLGPSILRAGTAGPIACAIASDHVGNWD